MNALANAFGSEADGDPPACRARISLIIDDIGSSPSRLRPFLDLGIPITFAILPKLRYSQEHACEIHRQGHEIILHQPMEPFNRFLDPGPGALYVGDEEDKIVKDHDGEPG